MERVPGERGNSHREPLIQIPLRGAPAWFGPGAPLIRAPNRFGARGGWHRLYTANLAEFGARALLNSDSWRLRQANQSSIEVFADSAELYAAPFNPSFLLCSAQGCVFGEIYTKR